MAYKISKRSREPNIAKHSQDQGIDPVTRRVCFSRNRAVIPFCYSVLMIKRWDTELCWSFLRRAKCLSHCLCQEFLCPCMLDINPQVVYFRFFFTLTQFCSFGRSWNIYQSLAARMFN
jgi:hypothetical protein